MFDNLGLYHELIGFSGAAEAVIGGKVQAALTCPYCGASSSPRNEKASFGNITPPSKYGGWAFHCFSCGTTVSMRQLATDIGMDIDSPNQQVQTNVRQEPTTSQRKQKEYTWMQHTDELVAEYTHDPSRFTAWDTYKNLGKGIVYDWQLGVGILPETRYNEKRLITPIYTSSGSVQWLRGRLPKGVSGTKWVGAGGVSPTAIELSLGWMIQKGKPLFICENYVDALIINYYLGDYYSAVPTFSVSYWAEAWVKEIVDRKPSQVIVAFDPDLAGNGPVSKEHARKLFTDRICKLHDHEPDDVTIRHLKKRPKRWSVQYEVGGETAWLNLPEPFGIQRAAALNEAGIPAKIARWRKAGHDIGDFLSAELAKQKKDD